MTSSTPELTVLVDGRPVPNEARTELPGRGDLEVHSAGHPPGAAVPLQVGARLVEPHADADGVVRWRGPRLLGQVAGELRISIGGRWTLLVVRPDKLLTGAITALIDELEAVADGLAQDVGAHALLGALRSREHDLSELDRAVGLAASAAPAIRRRPIHRAREVVRAAPREQGPRSAADVRWLATHPLQAARVAATGRPAGVVREREADLDTIENRGVLATYDRLEGAVLTLRDLVDHELGRLDAARPAREAFLTEGGSLWTERDQPRQAALERRRARLDALGREVSAARTRAGLPDLRPRSGRMVRTARVDAEPAYWSTFLAHQAAERAEARGAPPAPAPVRTLDALWEQWVAIRVLQAVTAALGPPDRGQLVDPGWFATLRQGELARWSDARRTVRVLYEPEYAFDAGEPRKLHPGRPWRPDLVIELRWADGTLDLHVLDAKYRLESGGPPREALRELWWRYGDGIGDAAGLPVVRSLWAVAPGDGLWLVAPGMLAAAWPAERLRGGCVSITPGRTGALDGLVRGLLAG